MSFWKMIRRDWWVFIPHFVAVCLVGWLGYDQFYIPHSVRPGQVWVYHRGNPFTEGDETNTVIAIQRGYVKYSNPEHGEVSCTIRYFIVGSDKISNGQPLPEKP